MDYFLKIIVSNFEKITGFGEGCTYNLTMTSLGYVLVCFIGIFLLFYAINMIQLKLVNLLELLKGTQTGEKEPKVK